MNDWHSKPGVAMDCSICREIFSGTAATVVMTDSEVTVVMTVMLTVEYKL